MGQKRRFDHPPHARKRFCDCVCSPDRSPHVSTESSHEGRENIQVSLFCQRSAHAAANICAVAYNATVRNVLRAGPDKQCSFYRFNILAMRTLM
jgi:hypothetical protein